MHLKKYWNAKPQGFGRNWQLVRVFIPSLQRMADLHTSFVRKKMYDVGQVVPGKSKNM
jgi:hypothetical protein